MINKIKTLLVLVLCFSFLLTGCGASSSKMESASMDVAYTNGFYGNSSSSRIYMNSMKDMAINDSYMEEAIVEESKPIESSSTTSKQNVLDSQKLIRTVNMAIETIEFDKTLQIVKDRVSELNGYIESSDYNKRGNSLNHQTLTIRLPFDKVDAFIETIGNIATITRNNDFIEDVTLEYTDTTSRISSLKIEYDSLNKLLEQADSLETIIALQNRLTEVRYELENYESKLRLYDNLISYSTIHLDIQEEYYISPIEEDESVFSRIKTGLSDTFYDLKTNGEDFIVWFVVSLPYLVIYAIVLTIGVVIIRKVRKNKKAKKENKKIEDKKDIEK